MASLEQHLFVQPVFKYRGLQILFDLTSYVLWPFMVCLNQAVGPFLPVTPEKTQHHIILIKRALLMPIFIALILLFCIPYLVAFILRNILHQFRRPFCILKSSMCSITGFEEKSTFSVATSNLCLLPEFMARFNNLNNTAQRANAIGERIYADQVHYASMVSKLLHKSSSEKICKVKNRFHSKSGYETRNVPKSIPVTNQKPKVDIITHFPANDFLCVQEAFERDYTKMLVSQLQKIYPFIVYDVGYCSPMVNFCGLSSGLMVASRYEIAAIKFKPYSAKCGFCSIVGKGLLMMKVILGESNGCRSVGYLFNTHLQAFQGTKPIVSSQMSEILLWTTEFRERHDAPGEHVTFDILCGDFNIDNMSPGESSMASHELFEVYTDICREAPGKDHDWTVGTELRSSLLHDKSISTPEGLKAALEDPYLRQHYVIDADLQTATMDSIYNAEVKVDTHGNLVLSPVGGRRRIDVVLYRNDCPVTVKNFNFVTSLAPHTDHIPVSMTFHCDRPKTE
ncbi:sphingomyelin phosphodiesterase 3-like isoform X3 [Dreissena polymorpha]|nr:sphingomyelin phosphodiesterase 3-like isoform X3 [Dreissena polymorpha]XP_052231862.1 sphingomyelin phosphodiesterase 3-like isoform X3 [Dreissena polymorpha]